MCSFKNEDGTRNFTNELVGKKIYIDKVALEDLIKFQGVEFKIISGYYFDEGFNNKVVKTIRHLFKARLDMKKIKNPIQNIYKLIMNSSYGKTIMKPIDKKKTFYNSKEKADKYMFNNYNRIIGVYKIDDVGNKFYIKERLPINKHFSYPHIGVQILSMSKRIMNEVMTLAEDIGANIYYQDTDSMHIESHMVSKLAEEYKLKYDRDLIGSNMGQFHSDFDFESKDCLPVAVESLFLGKKTYIDKVRCVNGGIESFHYHIRMKGIPNQSILAKVNNKNYTNPIDVYNDLYNGKKVRFNLLEGVDGKKLPKFQFNNNMSIESKKSFYRVVTV